MKYLAKTVLVATNAADIVCLDVMDIPFHEEPTRGLEIYCRQLESEPQVIITQDDRGDGLCLFRRNDCPRIDFFKVVEHPDVVFAHKGGFVAKTKTRNLDEAINLIRLSVV